VANGVFWILSLYIKKLKLSLNAAIIIFLFACFIVAIVQALKYYYLLKKLGVTKIYNKAEETTMKGLQDADQSYQWLGTSAYYILCTPHTREKYIEPNRRTNFLFITLDPESSTSLSEQAKWQNTTKNKLAKRINETKDHIDELSQEGVNISWEGHSTFPTFRIIIIDKKKVFVNFYEEGKFGPQCEQLAIRVDGLLGQWFTQFFDKSRLLAKRMRIEKILGRLLFKKANISKDELKGILSKLCQDESVEHIEYIEQVVDDLSRE
jgi:hypothetical protein